MKPEIANYEYASRHQKARVLMEKNNLSALLITETANLLILEAGVEATMPGIPISDLYRVQVDAAQKLNIDMSPWPARRFGHGSGLHTTEPPYISPDDDTTLEAGMILHIEPGCIKEDGVYVLEEQILVTESGSKVLSRAPWELQA